MVPMVGQGTHRGKLHHELSGVKLKPGWQDGGRGPGLLGLLHTGGGQKVIDRDPSGPNRLGTSDNGDVACGSHP